jgi:CRP-like cAMP-binding protein
VIRRHRYPFPLRHQHIADAVGLAAVHVSRIISLFRDRVIVELSDGYLKVSSISLSLIASGLCIDQD